jgi:ASCH domain-containing protein
VTARSLASASNEQLLAELRGLFDAADPPPPVNPLLLALATTGDLRALTVHQPWAAAIVRGHKDIENRTRRTHRRGLILIHAGLKPDRAASEQNTGTTIGRWLNRFGVDPGALPYGAIVGVAQITGCHPARPWIAGGCCHPWGESRQVTQVWHWTLSGQVALREPVPCTGALGPWRPDADTLAAVLGQLGGAS